MKLSSSTLKRGEAELVVQEQLEITELFLKSVRYQVVNFEHPEEILGIDRYWHRDRNRQRIGIRKLGACRYRYYNGMK